jgi:NAD(P)-dependent dehydrogenase (short-subunit alcohol dehydrogenase family)
MLMLHMLTDCRFLSSTVYTRRINKEPTAMISGFDLLSTSNLPCKTAIVAGATSGIGLAMAEAFTAAGCNIALGGFGEAALIMDLVARLFAHGGKIGHSHADLSKPAQLAGLALFLCTGAAASITGAALAQDGGWTSR